MSVLFSLFQHKIKTEKSEDFVLYLNEVLKCANECLDYEDDINAKEQNYSKFEIKPVYIPNNKKRTRDKTLDIDLIIKLVQFLFDTYILILKGTSNLAENGNCKDAKYCLIVLQKLLVMKIMYLGEGRYQLLKIFQNGICSILFSKYGNVNHEEFCKLIFMLKKNYTVLDLSKNETFLNYLFGFATETFTNVCTENQCNYFFNGMIYLMRFFGYISHSFGALTFSAFKESIKTYIFNSLRSLIDKINFDIFPFLINDFSDIYSAFGVCGESCYFDLLKIIDNLLNEYNNGNEQISLRKISFLIIAGCELIKNNYTFYLDEKAVSKTNENEEIDFSIVLNDNEEQSKEVSTISTFILESFLSIKKICNNNKCEAMTTVTILHFIKFFVKNFFSSNISSKFNNTFNMIIDSLKISTPTDLLISIIKLVIQISNQTPEKDVSIIHLIIKIFRKIVCNICQEIDPLSFSQNITIKIGKLFLNKEDLINHLHILITEFYLLQKLNMKIFKAYAEAIFKIHSIACISIEPYINDIIMSITNEKLSLVYSVQCLKCLVSSIYKQRDYEALLEIMIPKILLKDIQNNFLSLKVVDHSLILTLKLIKEITQNSFNRINFSSNSQSPYQLLLLSKELLCHYYKIAKGTTIKNEEEKYLFQIKPISLFVKIFNNIFNIIQLSILVNSNYNYIKNLFDLLSDLIFSITPADILGYIKDMQEIFVILKVIFSDFIKVNVLISDHSKIEKISELLFYSIENNSAFKCVSKSIGIFIFELGKLKLNEDNPQEINYSNLFFEKRKDETCYFKKIIYHIFIMIVESDPLIEEEFEHITKILYILIPIYKEFYHKMYHDILDNSKLNEIEKGKIEDKFMELGDIYTTYSQLNYNYDSFKRNLEVFISLIKEVIVAHNNTIK